ncbi:hypothetical protein JB92DRAFT_2720015 [Gautieria morchelliformis]|nr:hypothetical protein JB92DRAFT_2720015 [Gautieria morchelliformis]
MRSRLALLSLLVALTLVHAHSHHDEIDEEHLNAPIDTTLYIHIATQVLVWGFIFPTGMVLGMTRSRWHVPLQSTALVLTAAGYILGHKHGGRMFPASLHGTFASLLIMPLVFQGALGVYLKLHVHEDTLRPWAVLAHGIMGKMFPLLGWCQMLFGAIVLGGYCNGGNLGQCLAHYIMGSAFIAYGIILAILLLVGQDWAKRKGRSQEWWDSWVIFLWGIVNTFTEHHGGAWSHKDLQHTSLGVLWWAGGALGILLSRNNKRNVVPSLIIIMTGWAMSSHAQAFAFSEKIHSIFGWTLMAAGIARLIEICFVVPQVGTEGPPGAPDGSTAPVASPFQHLPPFLLVAAGLLFMSGTDEELHYISETGMDHVTYVLIMYSLAFIIYALMTFLLHWYTIGRSIPQATAPDARNKYYQSVPDTASMFSGYTTGPRVLQDEEVYELSGAPDVDDDPFDDRPRQD